MLGRDGSEEQNGCTCRICQTALSTEELISPCNCKGSVGQVHLSCLERWLNACNREHCEICRYHFRAKRTRRYSLCQSLRVWSRMPRHRMMIRSDLLVAVILTLVTTGLCAVSVMGMRFFILEGSKLGVSSYWTQGILFVGIGTISLLLGVILLGYSATLYLMIRDHLLPWYRWWNRTTIIKLILVPEEERRRDVTRSEERSPSVHPVQEESLPQPSPPVLQPPIQEPILIDPPHPLIQV